MSTYDLYTAPPAEPGWNVPMASEARFSWEYDDGRERLLALYAKGKDKQWDAARRIDWDLEVDPGDVLGLPDESLAIYGTRHWDKLSPGNIAEMRQHAASWQFSQFLPGEQGAMICAAKIVETVPNLDAKFYAATQTIDEARHTRPDQGRHHQAAAPADPGLRDAGRGPACRFRPDGAARLLRSAVGG